jgi:hypothetical protein
MLWGFQENSGHWIKAGTEKIIISSVWAQNLQIPEVSLEKMGVYTQVSPFFIGKNMVHAP